MSKKFNFMCVGVQKAGTSTLHDIILQHPEVSLPVHKETHFFRDASKFEKGLGYYFSHYFDKSTQAIIGEIDPEYSYFPESAERILEAFGEIKIIFILREPVERAYSHYLMTKRRGLENLSFEEAIKEEEKRTTTHYSQIHYSYLSRGYYTKQIERFENCFGKENIKVLLFEDLIKNTENTIKTVSSFVGLSPYKFNYDIKSNPASEAKSKAVRDFIYKPNILKKIGGKLIPSKKLKDKLMHGLESFNLGSVKKEKMSLEMKKEIYEIYFKSEIERLEKHLGKNLSSWKF